jgi:tRNA threonylcarbamoyladenosine biosynthesis protein TsaB
MTPALTLAIDGSTYDGSVALIHDSEVVAERTLAAEEGGRPRAGRGERLVPAIADCMKEAAARPEDIARIVCGSGPGSFTSLRVAGSVAKGLAVGYAVDLYAVSSLLLTITGARPALAPGEYLSVLDAMRGEFYAARITVDRAQTAVQIEPARIVTSQQLEEWIARERGIKVAGPDKSIDARPHARGVGPLMKSIIESGPVDLASWEPEYGRLAEAQVRWEAAHGRPLPR